MELDTGLLEEGFCLVGGQGLDGALATMVGWVEDHKSQYRSHIVLDEKKKKKTNKRFKKKKKRKLIIGKNESKQFHITGFWVFVKI
jgi:hypothetical protein